MRHLLIAFALCLTLFAQTPRSEQDDPNPEWEGQKLECNNYKANAHPCHCALATSCDAHKHKYPDLNGDGDAEMGSRCKTFCRQDHCGCLSPCTSWLFKLTPNRVLAWFGQKACQA